MTQIKAMFYADEEIESKTWCNYVIFDNMHNPYVNR